MNGQYNIGDTVLGNWTLTNFIDEGGFGLVFEAVREDFRTIYKDNHHNNKNVAFKATSSPQKSDTLYSQQMKITSFPSSNTHYFA